MLFSTPVFLFVFLPAVLGSYFFVREKWRNGLLLGASLVFYAWGELRYVILLGLIIGGNYLFSRGLAKYERSKKLRKRVLAVGVAINLGVLGYFKYGGWIVENVNRWLVGVGGEEIPRLEVALPVGISFVIFHAVSYLVDIYRREVAGDKHFGRMALYMALFPQLIAGPILRYKDMAGQLIKRQVGVEKFAGGVKRFCVGLGKKVLIANVVGQVADQVFGTPVAGLSQGAVWLGVVSYTLQIYFDFSGYSDMAIGMGRMLGFEFKENFRWPYMAKSIQDFWRRWHISLSSWFRDYLYIPLGGNRGGWIRQYRNLIVVLLLCGLWHGASWTFVAWGVYHGVFLIIERWGWVKLAVTRVWGLNRVYTLAVVMTGWVFFRANSFAQAGGMIKTMWMGNGGGGMEAISLLTPMAVIGLAAGVVLAMPISLGWQQVSEKLETQKGWWWVRAVEYAVWLVVLMAAGVRLAGDTYNPFLYYRF